MTLATLDELFSGTPKRRFREVTLPVMGAELRIRSLTEKEWSGYQAAALNAKGRVHTSRMLDASRRLIALCLVDADGNQLLGPEHVSKLADWDAADTQFLYDQCAEHCGINQDDIEDLVKNSEATRGDSTPTD